MANLPGALCPVAGGGDDDGGSPTGVRGSTGPRVRIGFLFSVHENAGSILLLIQ